MNKRQVSQWIMAGVILGIVLSGCNFPVVRESIEPETTLSAGEPATSTQTPPFTKTAVPSATFTATPSETSTPTRTATEELTATLAPSAALTNTPVLTSTTYQPVSIRGQATIEKNLRILPLGAASLSLYDDLKRVLVTGTRTNFEGGFQFNALGAGKYYLVLVWIIKSSGWACARSSLPEIDRKRAWDYVVHGLPHHVQIQNRGDDTYVVSIGTGAFGYSGGGIKTIQIILKCNELS